MQVFVLTISAQQGGVTEHNADMMTCVATVQDPAGSWGSGRWKKMHGAVGMLDMPLFTGGRSTHTASCVPHCMSPVP